MKSLILLLLMTCACIAQEKKSPTYITAEQVKVYWVNQLKEPGKLDPNYHQTMQEYRVFVAEIKKGTRDLQARSAAATYNQNKAIEAGDAAMAKHFQEELRIVKEAEQAEASEAARRQEASRRMLYYTMLQSDLQRLNRNLSNASN